MEGIDAINALIRGKFRRHPTPWFSTRAWNLPVRDLDSHVPGNLGSDNQLKNVYPEIDIYAHARSIAQFSTGEGIRCQRLRLQLTGSFTRGNEMNPANYPAGHNV